ncbi:hypothetical protein [Corynebacterium variabile]
MTDITDQDRRAAMAWAKNWQGDQDGDTSAAARVILATVDAPEPTLAEEILDAAARIRDAVNPGDRNVSWADMESCANRAEQMEQDAEDRQEWNRRITEQVATLARERDEARAEVERERDLGVALAHERDEVRAEVERLTAEQHTERPDDNDWLAGMKEATRYAINATHPNPADVPAGEPWLVRVGGHEALAVRDGDPFWPWSVAHLDGGIDDVADESVTLTARLVPAPRVITNPDELEQLATRAVILSADDKNPDVYQRDSYDEWLDITAQGYSSSQVIRMERSVTVIYQPEEDQK